MVGAFLSVVSRFQVRGTSSRLLLRSMSTTVRRLSLGTDEWSGHWFVGLLSNEIEPLSKALFRRQTNRWSRWSQLDESRESPPTIQFLSIERRGEEELTALAPRSLEQLLHFGYFRLFHAFKSIRLSHTSMRAKLYDDDYIYKYNKTCNNTAKTVSNQWAAAAPCETRSGWTNTRL